MAELSKYDLLINDLKLIEAQVSTLKSKLKDSIDRNTEIEKKLSKFQEENKELNKKLGKFEKDFEKLTDTETNILNSLNLKERENLKAKLQNLLSRIDYHLSADTSHRRFDEVDRQV